MKNSEIYNKSIKLTYLKLGLYSLYYKLIKIF